MNNVIFGSGIVGLLAKAILGSSWKLVPFYRSRFFTFNPALDDNYIIRDAQLDPFIKDLTHELQVPVYPYARGFDVSGELVKTYDAGLCQDWLYKVFGPDVPSQAPIYLSTRMSLHVYDIRINVLYQRLVNAHLEELQTEAQLGKVTEIGDHYFIRNGVREDFDHAVSTIPLNVLNGLRHVNGMVLKTKPLHYLHVQTKSLDFEGLNQIFVTNRLISFYKVTNVGPERYLIFCHEEIPQPGPYLMYFMRDFDILDGTSIADAVPLGDMPKLEHLEKEGIFCVGSYAQWDWCADVGSNILRLLRYAQREFKPRDNLRVLK